MRFRLVIHHTPGGAFDASRKALPRDEWSVETRECDDPSEVRPWGRDSHGNIFCWLTTGDPDEWATTILGHGADEPASDAFNITTFLYNYARNQYPEMQGGLTFSESDYQFESR